MSKTDLRIRPIYHRLRSRIEAQICISFTAYSFYKELERALHKVNATFSLQQVTEFSQTMDQIEILLPESKVKKEILLKMDEEHHELVKIIAENY